MLYSNTYKLIQYFTVFYNFIHFVLNLNSPAYYTYILISHIISLSSFCTHFVLFSFIYSMERRHFFATPFTCYMATIGSICCWTYHHVVSLSHDQSLFVHFALYFTQLKKRLKRLYNMLRNGKVKRLRLFLQAAVSWTVIPSLTIHSLLLLLLHLMVLLHIGHDQRRRRVITAICQRCGVIGDCC